jgi:hypothetical protein
MEDLSGGWLGTYWYLGRRHPCRFEATLTHAAASGRLSGTVLDEGGLGSATVGGTTTGQAVTFTKVYADPTLEPVEYAGTVSEDGRSMSGHWVIRQDKRVIARGTWEVNN